jgi:outer membrane protein
MTLSEARAFARGHQPSLASALARVSAAQASATVTQAQWLPTLGLTAQALVGSANNTTASYFGVRDVDLPRIGGTRVDGTGSWAPHASTLVAGGVRQEIFDFGRIAAETAVDDALAAEERSRAEEERLRLDLLVEETFYGVEAAHAVERAARGAMNRAAVHRDMAAAAVKSGLHPPIELTRADADVTRFRVGWLRATGSLRAAQAALAAAVGAPEMALDTTGPPTLAPHAPSWTEAARQAAAQDPLLRAAAQRIQASELSVRALEAAVRPNLLLTATLSAREGTAAPSSGGVTTGYAPLPVVPNWDAGLVLSWPLFDGVIRARRKVAEARVAIAKADAAALGVERRAALQDAFIAFELNLASLEALQDALRAAEANDAQAEARFKSGLGTSVELADAEALRADAEIQLAVGRFEAARARARITRLMGGSP